MVGVSLPRFPGLIFDILGMPEVDALWPRIAGAIVLALTTMCRAALVTDNRAGIVASVIARLVVVANLLVLWATGEPWQLVLFAAADLLGATFTWLGLRSRPLGQSLTERSTRAAMRWVRPSSAAQRVYITQNVRFQDDRCFGSTFCDCVGTERRDHGMYA